MVRQGKDQNDPSGRMDHQPDEAEWLRAKVQVDGRWNWLQGHFPEKPIMPGVGLLWLVLQTLRQELAAPDLHVVERKRIRFRELVRPGASLEIFVEKSQILPGRLLRFRICCEHTDVAQGRIALR